jgi:hypothetical protein
MVKPCDKFQSLVVGPDGQTVTDPYGMIPSWADYEDWRAVTDSILTRAEGEITRWYEEHGAVPEEIYKPVEAVRERWDATGTVVEQLFSPDSLSWGPEIVSMVVIAQDAACQIGEVEFYRVQAGGKPSNVPARPANGNGSSSKGASSSKGGGKGMGLGLVLLVGAFFAMRGRE